MADGDDALPLRSASHARPVTLPVTTLKPDDVLFGKGSGYTEYVGNQSFLSLIEARKEAYNKATKNKEKARLANEFLEHIHSLGGRFLKRGENSQPVASVVEDCVWYEVDAKTALEKIKQAFRQNRDPRRDPQKKTDQEERACQSSAETDACSSDAQEGRNHIHDQATSSSGVQDSVAVDRLPSTVTSFLPLISLGPDGGCPIVDYSNIFSLHGAHLKRPPPSGTPLRLSPPQAEEKTETCSLSQQNVMGFASGMIAPNLYSRCLANSILRSQSPSTPLPVGSAVNSSFQEEGTCAVLDAQVALCNDSMPQEATSTPRPLDEDEAAFVLSALGLSDRPKITDEELKLEQSSLTEDEQARILNDLFGKGNSIAAHKSKRVKRDFNNSETRGYLLRQMRAEVNAIPEDKRQALLEAEAQVKCRREEFSDCRLEQFLRADGMNPTLAAQRFVNYWESRRELFGPEKFCLRMTLSEALDQNDVVALGTGMFTILPHPDSSGRPLVFIEPPRNTGKGYSAENMVRALWYLMEIVVREYAAVDGNFVWIIWEKVSPVWSYDRYLISHVPYYHRRCWPVREMPSHSFCSNAFERRIVKPLLLAIMDKAGRCRHTIHDVPKNGILETMKDYGMEREVLPTSVGGSVDLDKWLPVFIAQRRAIEMEEI